MTEIIIKVDDKFLEFAKMDGMEDQYELIRCKDCKFSSPNQVYGCRINSFADDLDTRMYSDDFCSRAERRTECG